MAEQMPTSSILTRLSLISGTNVEPARMHLARAGEMARHIKAALFHLNEADRIAESAGIDVVYAMADEMTAGHLLTNARDTMQELDSWASRTVHASNVIGVYDGTERWCHAPGGALPTTGLRSANTEEPQDRSQNLARHWPRDSDRQ
jgi:hypothetical protein